MKIQEDVLQSLTPLVKVTFEKAFIGARITTAVTSAFPDRRGVITSLMGDKLCAVEWYDGGFGVYNISKDSIGHLIFAE